MNTCPWSDDHCGPISSCALLCRNRETAKDAIAGRSIGGGEIGRRIQCHVADGRLTPVPGVHRPLRILFLTDTQRTGAGRGFPHSARSTALWASVTSKCLPQSGDSCKAAPSLDAMETPCAIRLRSPIHWPKRFQSFPCNSAISSPGGDVNSSHTGGPAVSAVFSAVHQILFRSVLLPTRLQLDGSPCLSRFNG